jgi:hypothetical protein
LLQIVTDWERGIQFANYKPIRKQSQQQNKRRENKTRHVGASPRNEYANHEWGHDTGKISGKIFGSRPNADFVGWRAGLQNCE